MTERQSFVKTLFIRFSPNFCARRSTATPSPGPGCVHVLYLNRDTLTATECKLVYELATHAGVVMTRGQILQRVWGSEYSAQSELLRSFIRNLRRKLGDDARNPRYIFTEPQVGYRMPRTCA